MSSRPAWGAGLGSAWGSASLGLESRVAHTSASAALKSAIERLVSEQTCQPCSLPSASGFSSDTAATTTSSPCFSSSAVVASICAMTCERKVACVTGVRRGECRAVAAVHGTVVGARARSGKGGVCCGCREQELVRHHLSADETRADDAERDALGGHRHGGTLLHAVGAWHQAGREAKRQRNEERLHLVFRGVDVVGGNESRSVIAKQAVKSVPHPREQQ